MKFPRLLLFFSFFIFASCQFFLEPLPPEFDATKLGTTERDITYCVTDAAPLQMDVYYPSLVKRQWPVIVYIHGGGYASGDKKDVGFIDFEEMRKAGILVVSVNYRLAPRYKFPSAIEDVKCAIRYLRAHAEKYNLDPERVGTMGGSVGGHFATLVGVADKSAGFDVGEYLEYSSRAQAVVSINGLADLAPPFTMELFFDRMTIFGTYDQHDPIFQQASPINYITPDDPPFLIIHGEADKTVPINQSVSLYRHLQRGGVSAEFITVKNADHIFQPVGGEPISPSTNELMDAVTLFWKNQLSK